MNMSFNTGIKFEYDVSDTSINGAGSGSSNFDPSAFPKLGILDDQSSGELLSR